MKIYGWTKTSLNLTDKARAAYRDADPLVITQTCDGRFNLYGIIQAEGLTADDVNAALESLADTEEEEETTMKSSEIIETYRAKIAEEMIARYRIVAACEGRVQYRMYIWSDGEIECLEQVQGDNSYLQARDAEPRTLIHLCKVAAPNLNLWDVADHAAPEDDAVREAEEQEIIDYLVDEYAATVDDIIDGIIDDYRREEEYDEGNT